MGEESDVAEESRRLEEFLSISEIHPLVMEQKLKEFSGASKNALVARLATTFNPPPPGRVLMRLVELRTPENEGDLTRLYVTNLRSPNPNARGASLHGLNELKHPLIFDFALSALHDDNDFVLFEACTVLLLRAADDPNILKMLQEVHASHAGDPNFSMTASLLEPLTRA